MREYQQISLPEPMPKPESIRLLPPVDRKVIPFVYREVPMMIYEDNDGLTHIEPDFREPQPKLRILEADRENPIGHEGRIYTIFEDKPRE